MNDRLCSGAGRTIHADDFENAIYEKMKEKLSDYKYYCVSEAQALIWME